MHVIKIKKSRKKTLQSEASYLRIFDFHVKYFKGYQGKIQLKPSVVLKCE